MTKSISERALIRRINRKLAHKDRRLHVSRGWREKQNLGDFYVLDSYRNEVIDLNINLQEFGTELEVLNENEVLVTN